MVNLDVQTEEDNHKEERATSVHESYNL